MRMFGGTSFFGMTTGSRGRNKRRGFQSPSNERAEEVIEPGIAACESAAGELRARRVQTRSNDAPGWMKRGLFKAGFNAGSPRVKSAKKYTK